MKYSALFLALLIAQGMAVAPAQAGPGHSHDEKPKTAQTSCQSRTFGISVP